ncbi:hypothetical protein H4R35_007384, partial [Dimargaris xerosporica]
TAFTSSALNAARPLATTRFFTPSTRPLRAADQLPSLGAMQALYHWFISKHRLVGFEVQVTLHELVNIPLVSGNFYVKWRIKNGSSSTGYTDRAPISEHRVKWDQRATKNAELVIGKDGVLSPCELHLWVKQEMNQESPRNLGTLVVNLAEYARQGEVSTRYLLQECKSNSTIKVSLLLLLTSYARDSRLVLRAPFLARTGALGPVLGHSSAVGAGSRMANGRAAPTWRY